MDWRDRCRGLSDEERARIAAEEALREAAWWDSRREIDPYAAEQAELYRWRAMVYGCRAPTPAPEVPFSEWANAKYSS